MDDIELRRPNEAYMDALVADRIPDPTTAGDFTRRFSKEEVGTLMEAINSIRPKLWQKRLSKKERGEALIDIDGTVAPTAGECKAGMGLSYKGIWGHQPLLISLAHTLRPLYLVNRSGNSTSHQGAVAWIDQAVKLVRTSFENVCLRGDTDFALTTQFDRWTADGVRFAFGTDAKQNLVKRAESLDTAMARTEETG